MARDRETQVGWRVGPTWIKYQPGVVRAAVAALEVPSSHDQLLGVTVRITSNDNNGFPNAAEGDALARIEDDLCGQLPSAVLFGVLTTGGSRHYFFYTDSTRLEESIVDAAVRRHPGHVITWSVVPVTDRVDWSRLQQEAEVADLDRRALEAFVGTGADLFVEHPTDYLFVSPTEEQVRAAEASLDLQDAVIEVHEDPTAGQWRLRLSISTFVNSAAIAKDRWEFTRFAQGFGGKYDGWGVATGQPSGNPDVDRPH